MNAPVAPRLPLRMPHGSAPHWLVRGAWVALTVAVVVYVPARMATGAIGDVTFALELAIAAMALNLVMGYGGVISLGHSAFFALGGYTTGILVDRYDWTQGWTLLIVPLVGFAIGAAVSLPALRLRGIYLALVTLGLAVLLPTLVRWQKLEWLTHGPRGIVGLSYREPPGLPFFGRDSARDARAVYMYWLAVVVAAVCYLVCRGIVKSRVGRSLVAIRDNETAAAVMGVDLARTKTLVFGVSAALCGLAGALYGIRVGQVNATNMVQYQLVGSILFLVIMVLGGAATLWGPLVGAAVFVWIDNAARDWGVGSSGPANWLFGWMDQSPAMLILALALVAMMFLAPFGLVGLLKRLTVKLVVIMPKPAGTGATFDAGSPADETGHAARAGLISQMDPAAEPEADISEADMTAETGEQT